MSSNNNMNEKELEIANEYDKPEYHTATDPKNFEKRSFGESPKPIKDKKITQGDIIHALKRWRGLIGRFSNQ